MLNISIFTFIYLSLIPLTAIWFGHWAEGKPKTEEEIKKLKIKKRFNIISSLILLFGLGLSYHQLKETTDESNNNLQQQLNYYKTLDTVKYIGAESAKRLENIKNAEVEAEKSLSSIRVASKDLSRSILNVKEQTNDISLSLYDNMKLSQENFSTLKTQAQKLQFPLPRQVELNLRLTWPILESGISLNNEIKRQNKKSLRVISNISVLPNRFIIDTSYNFYPDLFLAFKNLHLQFKHNENEINYFATLVPDKLIERYQAFYRVLNYNSFNNAVFTYDSSAKEMTLRISNCKFALTFTSSDSTSLKDIDNSLATLYVNRENDQLGSFIKLEDKFKYIYYANSYDFHTQGNFLDVYLNINFGGILNSTYYLDNPTRTTSLHIDNFKLGHQSERHERIEPTF